MRDDIMDAMNTVGWINNNKFIDPLRSSLEHDFFKKNSDGSYSCFVETPGVGAVTVDLSNDKKYFVITGNNEINGTTYNISKRIPHGMEYKAMDRVEYFTEYGITVITIFMKKDNDIKITDVNARGKK